MPVRRVRGSLLPPVALLATLTCPLSAQAPAAERSSAPSAGTWGAETGVGQFNDAAVLRFLSPGWAVLAGVFIQRSPNAGSVFNRVPGRTEIDFQAGLRKYHRSGLGLRPITGAGLAFGRIEGFTKSWGVFGEAGAAYLFNRHISVGAVGIAGFSRDGDQNTYTLLAPRVIASVFF